MEQIIRKYKRYPVFIAGGVIGFVTNLLTSFILTDIIHIWYFFSVITGTLISWTVFFLFNYFLTFRDSIPENFWKAYVKNMLFYIGSAPIGLALIYVLTSIFFIHYLLSLTMVVGVMSIISFLFSKRYVFINSK